MSNFISQIKGFSQEPSLLKNFGICPITGIEVSILLPTSPLSVALEVKSPLASFQNVLSVVSKGEDSLRTLSPILLSALLLSSLVHFKKIEDKLTSAERNFLLRTASRDSLISVLNLLTRSKKERIQDFPSLSLEAAIVRFSGPSTNAKQGIDAFLRTYVEACRNTMNKEVPVSFLLESLSSPEVQGNGNDKKQDEKKDEKKEEARKKGLLKEKLKALNTTPVPSKLLYSIHQVISLGNYASPSLVSSILSFLDKQETVEAREMAQALREMGPVKEALENPFEMKARSLDEIIRAAKLRREARKKTPVEVPLEVPLKEEPSDEDLKEIAEMEASEMEAEEGEENESF